MLLLTYGFKEILVQKVNKQVPLISLVFTAEQKAAASFKWAFTLLQNKHQYAPDTIPVVESLARETTSDL